MVLRKRVLLIIFVSLLILLGSPIKGFCSLTTEEEKKLGKKVFLEMEGKVEIARDLSLQTFLNKIGHSLVAQISPTPFEFRFFPIVAPDPNAFAIPGGYIFVTTGLIVMAENGQEVAGVLSHEISHVTQRHIAQLLEKSKKLNIASLAAMVAGVLLGGGGKATEAVAVTAMATTEALVLKYTREMETDADQNGLNLMIKAGYDSKGLITFLNKINKLNLTSAAKVPVYLATHPAVEGRISFLENLLQTGPKPVGPFKEIRDFKRIQAKAFVEEREPHVAISHFQSLIEANARDLDAYFGLGLAYRRMGRLDKAMEVFQNASSSAPKDLDILRELGIVYFLLGKLDQAIEKLEGVRGETNNQEGDLLTLYYLGRGYQEKEDYAKALPLLMKVKKEMPESIDVHLNLGSVYGRMGQKGLSHFYYGRHFELKGDSENALRHFKLALGLLESGSPEQEEAQREIKELSQKK